MLHFPRAPNAWPSCPATTLALMQDLRCQAVMLCVPPCMQVYWKGLATKEGQQAIQKVQQFAQSTRPGTRLMLSSGGVGPTTVDMEVCIQLTCVRACHCWPHS